MSPVASGWSGVFWAKVFPAILIGVNRFCRSLTLFDRVCYSPRRRVIMAQDRQSTSRVALIPAQRHAMILEILADRWRCLGAATRRCDRGVGLDRPPRSRDAGGQADFSTAPSAARACARARWCGSNPDTRCPPISITTRRWRSAMPPRARIAAASSVIFDAARPCARRRAPCSMRGIPLTAITNDLLIAQMLANSRADHGADRRRASCAPAR